MDDLFKDDNELLEQVLNQSRTAMRRLREAEEAVGRVVGEGKGANGRIEVASDGRGVITKVRFDPRVMRLDRTALAEEVVAALKMAQLHAEQRRQEIVSEALEATVPLLEPLGAASVRQRVEQVTREILGK
jgi:DNA-binding protein YbaB